MFDRREAKRLALIDAAEKLRNAYEGMDGEGLLDGIQGYPYESKEAAMIIEEVKKLAGTLSNRYARVTIGAYKRKK